MGTGLRYFLKRKRDIMEQDHMGDRNDGSKLSQPNNHCADDPVYNSSSSSNVTLGPSPAIIKSSTRIDNWLDGITDPRHRTKHPRLRYCHSAPPTAVTDSKQRQFINPPLPPSPDRWSCPPAPVPASPQTTAPSTCPPSDFIGAAEIFSMPPPTYAPDEPPPPSTRHTTSHPDYRRINLAFANIEHRGRFSGSPQDVSRLVETIRMDRDFSGPTLEKVEKDETREAVAQRGVESQVDAYYTSTFFPARLAGDLQRDHRQPLRKDTVPDSIPTFPISTPVPDLIYGYNGESVFSSGQKVKLMAVDEHRAVNSCGLMLPFLLIELKGVDGSLWAADNQCLGGASCCVLVGERLKAKLRDATGEHMDGIDTKVFSIAMSGSEARLNVSWKQDDLKYCTNLVQTFALAEPEQYLQFYKCVHNILDWGKGERLEGIRKSLDQALEGESKAASGNP